MEFVKKSIGSTVRTFIYLKAAGKADMSKSFSYKVFGVQFRSLGLKAIETEFYKQIQSKPRDNIYVFSLDDIRKKALSPKGESILAIVGQCKSDFFFHRN